MQKNKRLKMNGKSGRTYEVFVDGKPVGLVGSTTNSLKKRLSGGYKKRFGPTTELRLIREIPRPEGYSDEDFNFYLKAAETFDIVRKKTWMENGGLNQITPLAQAVGDSMLESEMGKVGGRLGGFRRFALHGSPATPESNRKGGLIIGQMNVESGHIQALGRSKMGSREGGLACFKLYGNPATPEGCAKGGKNCSPEAHATKGHIACHNRWHVKRGIFNSNCDLCKKTLDKT